MIAALFVDPLGVYNIPGVDCWGPDRDARTYAGPWPVVAHPPCQRWGRFWHGSTRKPHQYVLGDDDGCFAAALCAVQTYGGVLEHPAYTHAWRVFGLVKPPAAGGWVPTSGGFTCHVEQGHYGHMSRKATWLFAVGVTPRQLVWGPSPQRLHPVALERHGYAKARRIGMCAMVGGKNKVKIREATPEPFRDVLLGLVSTVRNHMNGQS